MEACQASLSFTISRCLLKLISIELVMPCLYYMQKKPHKPCIVLELGSILESLENLKTSRNLITTPRDADVIDEWCVLRFEKRFERCHNPWWLSGKESTCNAENVVSIPRLGQSPGERNGSPLQYSCLGNPMVRGAWQDPWGHKSVPRLTD